MSTAVKKPSWIPVLISALSIVLSMTIYFISPLRFSLAVYLAYFLTPFVPILSLAIARSGDTKARSNVFYDLALGKKIVSTALVLAIVGFVVAVPIIFHIASELSQI